MEQIREIILNGKTYKFTESAYKTLLSFLKHVKKSGETGKIYSDIEIQISVLADMETENTDNKIIDAEIMNEIIKVLKENRKIKFKQRFFDEKKFNRQKEKTKRKRNFLKRDKKNKIFAGVCSGLADFFGIDPVYIRVLFLIGALFRGVFIVVYVILWIIMPSEKENGVNKTVRI